MLKVPASCPARSVGIGCAGSSCPAPRLSEGHGAVGKQSPTNLSGFSPPTACHQRGGQTGGNPPDRWGSGSLGG